MAQIIHPVLKDLGGGLQVRRLLPAARCRSVGPFVFFDHFGPITAGPGDDHDVRPHPHIGLATVTYLFEGEMMHRDSTGAVQRLEPGALNLMTAGSGVVHSERTPDDLRGRVRRSHGLQLWLGLPQAHEEDPASFQHLAAPDVPTHDLDAGVRVKVLIGSAFDRRSAVQVHAPTLFLDLEFAGAAAATWGVAPLAEERALYSTNAAFELDAQAIEPHTLAVLAPGAQPELRAGPGARIVLIGGAPLGPRHLVWNFVSSRRERIDQAREDWIARRFAPVAGETEFIPYPGSVA